MSQRVVHYEIDAKYDAEKHTVDATEVLTYHNLTGRRWTISLSSLSECISAQRHLGARDQGQGGRDVSYAKWEDKDYGSEEIKSLEVVGQGDLTSTVQYIQPDDGNKDDKTVVDVHRAQGNCAGRVRTIQDCVPDQVSRDAGALGMEARFCPGRAVVPESRRCGGTEPGIAISITPSLSSLPTSASMT
jgi:hypothetical protein